MRRSEPVDTSTADRVLYVCSMVYREPSRAFGSFFGPVHSLTTISAEFFGDLMCSKVSGRV